jgi:hypothetical protein
MRKVSITLEDAQSERYDELKKQLGDDITWEKALVQGISAVEVELKNRAKTVKSEA